MPLRLVHVSDIHFRGYDDGWDYDNDQRNELLRDVRRIVESDGPIDGILVGGDIAFRAARAEYEAADKWLDQLRAECGDLDTGRVWTIPGNHDVDRGVIMGSDILSGFRREIRDCTIDQLDQMLGRRLSSDPLGPGLIAPFAEYNAFAAEYQCEISCKQPHWRDTSLQFEGLVLELVGLNSVLISDNQDSGEGRGRLILGQYQCMLPREDNTVRMVMAHHPPTWIRDWDRVQPYLKRAHALVFGHEHTFSARQPTSNGTVEVYGGAVGPDRAHGDPKGRYAPTYNVLTLARSGGDAVTVTIQPRYWDHDRTCFEAHPEGTSKYSVDLSQPPPERSDGGAPESEPIQAAIPEPLATTPRSANQLAVDAGTGPMNTNDTSPTDLRRIGTEYMRLPWTDRIGVARKLGVVHDEELRLPDVDLFPLVLRRIRDAGLIQQLIEELNRD